MIDLQLRVFQMCMFLDRKGNSQNYSRNSSTASLLLFLQQVFGQRSINRTTQVRFLRWEDGSLVIFNTPALAGRCIMRFSLSSNRKFPIYRVWLETFPGEFSFRLPGMVLTVHLRARVVFGQ